MTVDECIAAAAAAARPITCLVDSSHWYDPIVATVSVGSGVAIIAAAIFAWIQIREAKTAMKAGSDNHLSKLLEDKNIAVSHIDASAKNARLRATLDLLVNLQTDPVWAKRRADFIKLRDTEAGLEQYANKSTEETEMVRAQLNQYELIAIGIKLHILDADMFKTYYRTTYIRDHIRARNFIDKERRGPDGSPRFWIEFESLASSYEAEMAAIKAG